MLDLLDCLELWRRVAMKPEREHELSDLHQSGLDRHARLPIGAAWVLVAHAVLILALIAQFPAAVNAADKVDEQFREHVQPILEDYCGACHGNGMKKGSLALDEVARDRARLGDGELWWAVLKNVRAGIMPPAGKPRLTGTEQRLLEDWIKYGALGIDPNDPDPGSVTVRRLNRVEYRNTIRDLMGVDYDTSVEFPPDDASHGFDNIADALTLSPLLLEKYLTAAKSIVAQVVPMVPRVVAETKIAGQAFRRAASGADPTRDDGPLSLSYYEPASVTNIFHAEHPGRYQFSLDLTANQGVGSFGADYNRCRVLFKVDGRELLRKEYSRQDDTPLHYELDLDCRRGDHDLTFVIEPLTPGEKQLRALAMRIDSVTARGPWEKPFWVRPPNYSRFFPTDPPEAAPERRLYARELLGAFARKAFRRPADDVTLNRLAALAERGYLQEGRTFEASIGQAMAAVLASPMFLYREEGIDESAASEKYPLIDEYALASRLSYFLWSTMPDAELFRLAEEHSLRKNLSAQLERMLADPRSGQFTRHFVGQWLQARDIETVPVNAFAVIYRDQPTDPEADRCRARLQALGRRFPAALTDKEKNELNETRAAYFSSFRRFREHEMNSDLRLAMRRETEMLFDRIVRDDRNLRELLVSDYTFLNERLAKLYGIDGVKGNEMR